ncbi:MAG: phytanoyl-CoA dioxygenase family protein, partial [Candidatus Rokubacteria bacterium]|nr:phytanoyl-CoA dioxygenase family protein [Candidatus Rokubacteria bacterium]
AALDGVAARGARVDGYDDPRMLAFQREVMLLDDLPTLRRHPAILSVLGALFGEPAEPTLGDVPRVAFPRAPDLTTPPHQDHYYVAGATDLWTVWVPLGDCPRALGVLSLVPGSHRGGLLPHPPVGVATEGARVPEDSVWAAGDLACGDVVMFHGLTVHAACENATDRLRLSIDFRYRPARPRPPAPYVAARGARLYHRGACPWVARLSEPGREGFERAAEAEGRGLAACPVCEPSIATKNF